MTKHKINMTKFWLDSNIKNGMYQDRDCSPLWLRVGKTRKSFQHRYYFEGQRVRFKLGVYPHLTLAKAREKVHRNQALLNDGIDPRHQADIAEGTFGAMCGAILKDLEKRAANDIRAIPGPRTCKDYRNHFDTHLKPLHKVPMATMKVADIVEVLKPLSDRTRTYNLVRATVSALFSRAMSQLEREYNPAKAIPPLKSVSASESGQSDLSFEQIALLWIRSATLQPIPRAFIRIQLYTGQRAGSICKMEWPEIENDIWSIPQEKFKGRRLHVVPISNQLKKVLDDHQSEMKNAFYKAKRKSNWVLPAKRASGKTEHLTVGATSRIYKMAQGIKRNEDKSYFTSHALRKTTETQLLKIGCDDIIVDHIIGHQQSKLRQIYDKNKYLNRKRVWLQKYADHIDQIISDYKAAHPAKIEEIKAEWLEANNRRNKYVRIPEERLLAQWDRYA